MFPKIILSLAIMATMSACATTGTKNVDGSESATASTPEKQKMSCRRVKSTTTRLGDRICTPVGSGNDD